MSKYIKVSEQKKMSLEEINKVGVLSFRCILEGNFFDYYELKLANGRTQYWKTRNSNFALELRMVEVE